MTVDYGDDSEPIPLLRRWLRQLANKELPQRLADIAAQTGFNYSKCIVRSQKTRWGSCSSSGTISLNDQLLFLPARHVDYLMLHELCHTRHMNHSPAFWQLVATFEPDYQHWEQTLDRGRQHVPAWFMQSLYQ